MTRVIFSGVEVGSNRTLLEGQKVELMGLNFWGLKKRGLPKTKLWLISEHFNDDTKVIIESGATQADAAGLSRQELMDFAAEYQEFVANNADRATAFLEFDSLTLGQEWVEAQRPFFEHDPKLWVVWHQEYGLPTLKEMSSIYGNFPINAYEAESRRLSRFFRMGHTPGTMDGVQANIDLPASREFPFTLDMRR